MTSWPSNHWMTPRRGAVTAFVAKNKNGDPPSWGASPLPHHRLIRFQIVPPMAPSRSLRGLALLLQAAVCAADIIPRPGFAPGWLARSECLRPAAKLSICSAETRSRGVDRSRRGGTRIWVSMCEQKDDAGAGIAGKAAWVAAEALGNAARVLGATPEAEAQGGRNGGTIDRQDAIARLKADYERDYFISGEVDGDLYEEDCLFAGCFPSAFPTLCSTTTKHSPQWLLPSSPMYSSLPPRWPEPPSSLLPPRSLTKYGRPTPFLTPLPPLPRLALHSRRSICQFQGEG